MHEYLKNNVISDWLVWNVTGNNQISEALKGDIIKVIIVAVAISVGGHHTKNAQNVFPQWTQLSFQIANIKAALLPEEEQMKTCINMCSGECHSFM
jgi:hypothetical protein